MKTTLLQQQLEAIGYLEFKHPTKSMITVLTDDKRTKVAEHIVSVIPGAEWHRAPISQSSIGYIAVGDLKILIKPLSKQKRQASHSINEDLVAERINFFCSLSDLPLNVILTDGTVHDQVFNVMKADCTGTSWKGRQKADVVLTMTDGSLYKMSIKMDNASYWESSDRYYKLKARAILTGLIESGDVELIKTEHDVYRVSPNVCVQATEWEARDIIFGSDIEGNGAVLVRSFENADFIYEKDDHTLTIKCTKLIKTLENVDLNNDTWFVIRNDSTYSDGILPGFKGLRTTAANARACKSTHLKVDLEWRNILISQKSISQS